jgi:hypothetical protein
MYSKAEQIGMAVVMAAAVVVLMLDLVVWRIG